MLATVVSKDADLLPARVMMVSARRNAALPPTVRQAIFVTEDVSQDWARALVQHDGVSFEVLKSLDLSGAKSGIIPLFGLDSYDSILYLSPYTLVKSQLEPLLSCKPLCAMFHTPCSFSTGIMAISPDSAVHAALERRASASRSGTDKSCRPGNAPDWLDEEGCLLNAHFGKELLNASVFRIGEEGRKKGMRRLPSGAKMMHYFFYPRMRWEVPDKCGRIRTVDYTTPPLLRPWYWWTFAAMDLSWEWREYRIQLSHPPGMTDADVGTFVLHAVVILMCAVLWSMWLLRGGWGMLMERSEGSGKMREQEVMLYVLAGGLVGCLASWGVGFTLTPATLAPAYGIALFGMYRVVTLWGFWCAFGGGFIAAHAVREDGRLLRARGRKQAVVETGVLCAAEMVSVVALFAAAAAVPVGTAFDKVLTVAPPVVIYFGIFFALVVRLGFVWLSVGAKERFEVDT